MGSHETCLHCGSETKLHSGTCINCIQVSGFFSKYTGLKSILTEDAQKSLYSGRPLDTDVSLDCKCQQCGNVRLNKLKSVLKSTSLKIKDSSYLCLTCSKKGKSGIGLEQVSHLIRDDVNSSSDINDASYKTKMVSVLCEDCGIIQNVRLQSVLNQARRHKKSGRDCLYKCFDCGIKREDAIIKAGAARALQLSDGFKSGLEIAMEARLNLLGFKFIPQYQIDMYVCDFFLPDHNVIFEVNGEYWHGLPENAAKDKAKRTYISRYHPEYKVVTVEERNFFNPKIVDKIIIESLGVNPDLKLKEFTFKDVSVVSKTNEKDYSDFLNSYHYAKRGRKGKYVYEARLDGVLIGVCKFNSPTRQTTADYLGVKWTELMELDRFCIHPEYQKKNFASWFIARCVLGVFNDVPVINKLVSYADSTFGHAGTIYKASNWTKDGNTKPSYHYLDRHGIPINKKRVYDMASKMQITEREYVEKHGLRKIREKAKSRYVFNRS